MIIDWRKREMTDRLWSAVLASINSPINYNEIARIYGQGATYNSIEGQTRKFRKQAVDLKAEAVGRHGPAPSPAKPRVKNEGASPAKKTAVKGSRVTKSKATTPRTKVKSELFLGQELPFDLEDVNNIKDEEVVADNEDSDEDAEFV